MNSDIAPGRDLVLDHCRGHLAGQPPHDAERRVDLHRSEPAQTLAETATRRGFVQAQQLLAGFVGSKEPLI